jgi:hypothetical protein
MSLWKELDCYVYCCGVEVYNDGMCGEKDLWWWGHACWHMCLRTSHSPNVTDARPSRHPHVRPLEITCGNTRLSMAGAPGPIRKAWYQWKMQRFPWRKKWLVGECRPRHRPLAYPCFVALTHHRLRSPGQHLLGVQRRTARTAQPENSKIQP